MNKRILLALYVRSGLGAYMPVDYKGHELEVEEHMEKFAELIVKECAGIIESQDVDPSFKLRMSWAVKQYFGVKS